MDSKDNTDKFKENTRRGRIGRYARVSTRMSGLAAKLAGEKYLGLDIKRDDHARKIMEVLGDLKGPLLKVAQILATIPEALPKEYAMELQKLQSDAPPMGWPFVKRRMAAELGKNWPEKFKNFDRVPTAAASLGQVHKAVTLDDETVACKLQYPDMHSAVEADLNQLKVVLGLFEKYDKSFSTEHMQEEIADRLREELDYTLEAKYTKLYAHMLRDEKNVHIAEIKDELSTDRLITSSWLDGDRILNYVDADAQTRSQLALNMFRAWYVPLYYYGTIHGDPHLGNYTVRDDLGINLLDFGCVRIFPPTFVEGVINLYRALLKDDRELAVHAYESWGFTDMSNDLIDVLNQWAGFLYGPILEDKIRKIGEVQEGQGPYGKDTAQKVHQELRALGAQNGGIKVPREFVFMDRAALGLGSVFIHLKAEVNWYQVFNELIDGFDVKKLEKRQSDTLKKFDL